MNLLLLLDMAASDRPDAVVVQTGDARLTVADLLRAAWSGAAELGDCEGVAYTGPNAPAFPIALFAAAAAGVPFIPLNYRLSTDQLDSMIERCGDLIVLAAGPLADDLAARGRRVVDPDAFARRALAGDAKGDVPDDTEEPALLLHTSGTTSTPKAAVLRHRHLTSYVVGSVEFGGAGSGEAVLVSVPPYHIAGVANLISNLYLGRRIVYLEQFDAAAWLDAVDREGITHAMVVPTMLARICDALDRPGHGRAASLRALSYGGARTPSTVLERAVALLPHVDFTNAYGLTETSSTIAVLGPDDHRAALRDDDAIARGRLASAGRVLPTVEVEVREADGSALAPGEVGEIWVRGEQVSGEYAGLDATLDADGWFPTRDRGWVDDEGYLFIEGRADDTIIRGGENVAPAEVEEVLLRHPDVHECAVVGVPDEEWGQKIAAVIVPRAGATLTAEQVQDFARDALRGSKTPDLVVFDESLPTTETGKLLRRFVRQRLLETPA